MAKKAAKKAAKKTAKKRVRVEYTKAHVARAARSRESAHARKDNCNGNEADRRLAATEGNETRHPLRPSSLDVDTMA